MNLSHLRKVVLIVGALAGTPFARADLPYNDQCEPITGAEGTDYFDYFDLSNRARLLTVETHHFMPQVESLQKGQTDIVPADLDFVLRAFPNHHRALFAMARWQRMHPKVQDNLSDRIFTVDCYFKRAISINEKDSRVRMMYGTYLHQRGELAQADKEYALAEELGPTGAELFYNRGLLKLQMGDVASARAYAAKAYELGYPLSGLRDKLAAVKPSAKAGTATPPLTSGSGRK